MKRLIVNSLWLMVLFALFTIYHIPYTTPSALAEDASSSASPSGEMTDKINALKQEIASKAAIYKTEINKKLMNKAYVGKISSIAGNKIILQGETNTMLVLVNEYTIYSFKAKKADLSGLSVNDTIAALGDADDKGELIAKKVVKFTQLKRPVRQNIWGKVISVTNNSILLEDKDHKQITLTTNGDTLFRLGSDEASILDAKVNRFLVGVGLLGENSIMKADFVYLMNNGGLIKPEKKATPSTTPSASPRR